jgi:hypothetical protein
MTGDPFYLTYYSNEYEQFKPFMTADDSVAFSSLKRKIKEENGNIISAWLCLYFSAVDDTDIQQMKATLENPSMMRASMMKTPYHDEDAWTLFLSIKPELIIAFDFLDKAGFKKYWSDSILPKINAKINEIKPELPKYDVIKEDESLLGFKLPSDKITVYMLYFSQPHGIKITGTRFLTDIAWPFKIVLCNAVHEMMHPPYDYTNSADLRIALDKLKNDEFLMDKVQNHNPSFGYNSFQGFIEEDCVQVLEQIINEKLGIQVDAVKRWMQSDDGMHVFAVALYSITKKVNYNYEKELFKDFLVRIINSVELSNGAIKKYYDIFYPNKQ